MPDDAELREAVHLLVRELGQLRAGVHMLSGIGERRCLAMSARVVVFAALLGAGCDGGEGTARWTVVHPDDASRARAVRVEAQVLRGHCLSDDAIEGPMDVETGAERAMPSVDDGSYAIYARALDTECRWYAAGCVEVELPVAESGTVTVTLRPTDGGRTCPPSTCVDGECTGTCEPLPETCNRMDDDCDGRVDEDFDLGVDPAHCGFCEHACSTTCSGGHCGEEAILVGTGSGHTCAVRRNGEVFCWGANSDGQLGDGTTYSSRQCEDGLIGAAARHCGMGNAVRLAVPRMEGGEATSEFLSGAVAVGAGRDHACVARDDGRAYCWGDNDYGRLGDGTTTHRTRAVPVRDAAGESIAGVIDVATGDWPSCAIHADGGVSCWGPLGSDAVVSITDASPRPYAARVASITGAEEIDVGYLHACVVAGGQVLCWGSNDEGQLGDDGPGRTSPAAIAGIDDAVDVATGGKHSCAVHADGTVSCWGANAYGQLGTDDMNPRTSPAAVVGLTDAVQISAGPRITCARRRTGGVACWGDNSTGALGDGTTDSSSVPVDVQLSGEFQTAVHVGAGLSGSPHACAVLASGEVYCWGSNVLGPTQWGRLGNVDLAASETDISSVPERVSGIP